jgi:hypothetical protein
MVSFLKQSRWFRRSLWLTAAYLAYTLVGFLVLPPVIRWQLEKRLPGITKRQASVQQVKFNPWTLALTVRGLALVEKDGHPFVAWDELFVDFQVSSLVRRAWTFDTIRLVRPSGEVILLKDGRLNFANLFDDPAPTSPPPTHPAAIPRINIFHLEVTNGFVALEDRTRRSLFRTEYRPINLRLHQFSTRPESDTPYAFSAESDAGRSITWAGDLAIQPLRSSGRLELTGIRLGRYQPYLEDFTRALVTNGLADIHLAYRFSTGTNGTDLLVSNAVMHVEQVQVVDPDTGEAVAGLQGLEIEQAELNLREHAARVGTVRVSEAAVLARLKPNAHLNLLDLLTPPVASAPTNRAVPEASASTAPIWSLTVDDFLITNAAVTFEDLTRHSPFRTTLKPIEFKVKGFTTKPDVDATYSFQVVSESAEKLEGTGTVSINPIRSHGEVRLAGLEVKKYLPYVEPFFRGRVTGGQIEGQIPYRFALLTNTPLGSVSNLSLKLSHLDVRLPENDEQVTHLEEVAFERVDVALEARRGRIGLFKASGGSVVLRRQKDGALNLLGLLAVSRTNEFSKVNPAPDQPGAALPSRPPPGSTLALGGWVVNLDELSLRDYTLKVEDLQPAKRASFLFDRVALSLRGVNTLGDTPVTAALSVRVNQTGIVALTGSAKLAPATAEFRVALTNLDVRAVQPYLDSLVRLGIVSGSCSAGGTLTYQTNQPTEPRLAFAGDCSVTNLVLTDQVRFQEFVAWDGLELRGIDLALQPNHFKLAELRLVRPRGQVVIGPDRRPNLSLILPTEQPATNPAVAMPSATVAPSKPAAAAFPVELDQVTLEQATFGFVDESIQPRASITLEGLDATIKGLSSTLDRPADIRLVGKIAPQSPFAVSGRASPFARELFLDLAVSNANAQLTPLTGYMEKYAGHPLNKGRLSTSLHYRIEARQLTAENKIQIDQLVLGPRNNSPEAPKLPVKLGVALLKDANGRIELDIPISGRIDDPQFRVGPIVLKVVVNTLVKAATSPFKLLGALVGGGGDELSYVAFRPGSTNVVDGELDKLSKLAAALAKRPALNLEIEGAIDVAGDREALAHQKLHDQLKARRLAELAAMGRPPEALQGFQLEPEERDRLLRLSFIEQFGTNITRIIQTNQSRLAGTNGLLAAAPPPRSTQPEPGLFKRFLGLFHSSGKVKNPAEKRLKKADRQALALATPELMEEMLAARVQVSADELRQLMSSRARWAEAWFLQGGKITADRLFVVAPKPVDGAYRGESRVNLTLN